MGGRRRRARAGRTVRGVTFIMLFAGTAGVLQSAGCTSHAQRRIEAERRWNRVRARVKYQLAAQYYDRGEIDEAIEAINGAIASDPSSADQFLLLARCHLEQGRSISARAAAEQARQRAPRAAAVYYMLGVIAERAGELDNALNHYHRARMCEEAVVDYIVAEAECLTALNRPQEAIELVSSSIGRVDSDGTLEMLAAHIHLLLGDRVQALRNLESAVDQSGCIRWDSDHPVACSRMIEEYGRLLVEMGRYVEAVTLLRPLVETGRDPPQSVVAALCTAYLADGRVREAQRVLRKEVERRPDGATSWMLLARVSIMTEDWMTARHCAEVLQRLEPNRSDVHLLRGFVCWMQQDLEEAVKSLEQALAIDPADPLLHCLTGRVLEESGHSSEVAEAHYRRALRIEPQYAWALQLLDSSEREPISAPRLKDYPAPSRPVRTGGTQR
ncbi:MAG: tetratricopeptide repeat protein [Phycisphaerae bacterium]